MTGVQTCAFRSGWESVKEGKCVILLKEERRWSDAESFCKNQTGHLASVSSEEELVSIQSLCANETHGCWIGGRQVDSTNGSSHWKWTDNETEWNSSLLIHDSSLASNCSASCSRSSNCTLVAQKGRGLEIDGCNVSHPFLCTLTEG